MGPFKMLGLAFDTAGDGMTLLRNNMRRQMQQSDAEDAASWHTIYRDFVERGFTKAQSLKFVNEARTKRGLPALKQQDLD